MSLQDDCIPLSTLSSGIEDLLDQFKKRIEPYWAIITKHDPLLREHSVIDSIDFDNGAVTLTTQYCDPGYNQWYDHEINIDFLDLDLTLEEFEGKVIQGHETRREWIEEQEKEKKRQAQEESDRQDRRTFERLKKKFGADDPKGA